MERCWPLRQARKDDVDGWCREWQARFARIEKEFQAIVPVAIVEKIDKRRYSHARFAKTAREMAAPDDPSTS